MAESGGSYGEFGTGNPSPLIISTFVLGLLEAQQLDEVIQHNLLLGMKSSNSVSAHSNFSWLNKVHTMYL